MSDEVKVFIPLNRVIKLAREIGINRGLLTELICEYELRDGEVMDADMSYDYEDLNKKYESSNDGFSSELTGITVSFSPRVTNMKEET